MSDQPAWDFEALRNKASLYFARAFAAAESEEDSDFSRCGCTLGLSC